MVKYLAPAGPVSAIQWTSWFDIGAVPIVRWARSTTGVSKEYQRVENRVREGWARINEKNRWGEHGVPAQTGVNTAWDNPAGDQSLPYRSQEGNIRQWVHKFAMRCKKCWENNEDAFIAPLLIWLKYTAGKQARSGSSIVVQHDTYTSHAIWHSNILKNRREPIMTPIWIQQIKILQRTGVGDKKKTTFWWYAYIFQWWCLWTTSRLQTWKEQLR